MRTFGFAAGVGSPIRYHVAVSEPPPSPTGDLARLRSLFKSGHPAISIITSEECDARALVLDHARGTGEYVWEWTLLKGVHNPLSPDEQPIPETTNPSAAMYWLSRRDLPCIAMLIDVAGHLSDPHALRALRDLIATAGRTNAHVVLIDHHDGFPDVINAHVTPFELRLPSAEDIEATIRHTLKAIHRRSPIKIELTTRQYQTIVKNLCGLSRRHVEQIVRDVVSEDRRFDAADLNQILASKRRLMSRGGLLEFVESPASLDEVGGLDVLKQWLRERENSFSEDAAEFGLTPPRGVLMLGVQGAGKSLCAKAIATAWHRPLLRMDPGALYDRYVGESERRLRAALQQAEAVAPVVLWIDEIEKAFASAAAHSTDGGLSQRMFGTLLTWMQDHVAPVFVVATANNIDALPPELLRKGRFDEIFFVDLPTHAARERIFSVHLNRRGRKADQYDLDFLARATEGYSGAEIEQAVISALHNSFANKVELTTELLAASAAKSPPLSVTMAEKVTKLRAWARDRCVHAG